MTLIAKENMVDKICNVCGMLISTGPRPGYIQPGQMMTSFDQCWECKLIHNTEIENDSQK